MVVSLKFVIFIMEYCNSAVSCDLYRFGYKMLIYMGVSKLVKKHLMFLYQMHKKKLKHLVLLGFFVKGFFCCCLWGFFLLCFFFSRQVWNYYL